MSSPATAAPRWLGAAPALFLLLWSCGFVVVKLGLADADPLTFLALRYACVVTIFGALVAWRRPALPAHAADWLHMVAVGLLLQAGYFCFTYLSMKHGASAGAVALITSQQPILVALLAPFVAGERVTARHWLGLLLGVAGAVVVIVAKSGAGTVSVRGLIEAVLALATLTGGTLWEKRFGTAATDPMLGGLVQYAVGLAVAAGLAVWLEPMRIAWTPALVGSLAYLVIGNSVIAMSLLLAMVRHGEASRVSALFFLVPPMTAVIAWLLIGERIPPGAWPGMALAAAGIYLVMRHRR